MKNTLAIEAVGLTKRFGGLTAVDHLDLSVKSGEILALLGPNGAGKSTTTEMILGLQKPDEGTLRIFGRSPREAVLNGDIGAMLQNGVLLWDTNVHSLLKLMHGLYAHPLPLNEVIERARLSDILRSSTNKLSGGQAQRVRFALAIMGDPQLLLLDEPTVGFDVDARRSFWANMEDLASDGRTIVFATHYLDEADEFAERIVVMRSGAIAADGTGAEIKATVGGRHITFQGPDKDYAKVPGVVRTERLAGGWRLICSDSDAALRTLMEDTAVTDVEVTAPRLEDAFVELVTTQGS